jgi:hypothetical protein
VDAGLFTIYYMHMDIVETTLDFLLPKAYAQSYDGVAQPTFGLLNVNNPGFNQAQINLITANTTIKVGQTFVVEVEVETGDFSINEYQLVFKFDTTRLSVVDAKNDVAGTQIELVDTVFQSPSNGNLVENGQIRLVAKTPSTNALQVNRIVAKITFQAQSKGSTVIEPVEGISGAKLINQNGVALNAGLNSLTLNIGTQAATSTSTTSTSRTSTSRSSTSRTSSSGGPIGEIPATGILDELPTGVYAVIGIALVIVGLHLANSRAKNTKKTHA